MREPVPFPALRQFYGRRRVLVTGHTGFKGSWLALWLARLGAEVYGLALAPDQGPDNLYERAGVARAVRSAEIDIRDAEAVLRWVREVRPQLVFHLAARAWIQQGYDDPLATFATNTLGTAHVLEAARQTSSVEALLCVTTDKVYRESRTSHAYREGDELGGFDPYSASKAAAELIARCYGHALRPAERDFALATARGGNVLGGGDWSPHRIVPDIVRAIRDRQPLQLRRPEATRPWQHVLDLSHGYLLLGYLLATDGKTGDRPDTDHAWNFGPALGAEMTVSDLVATFLRAWGEPDFPVEQVGSPHQEANALRLDSSRAKQTLGWKPLLETATAVDWTADWYRRYLSDTDAAAHLIAGQFEKFEDLLTANLKTGAASTRAARIR